MIVGQIQNLQIGEVSNARWNRCTIEMNMNLSTNPFEKKKKWIGLEHLLDKRLWLRVILVTFSMFTAIERKNGIHYYLAQLQFICRLQFAICKQKHSFSVFCESNLSKQQHENDDNSTQIQDDVCVIRDYALWLRPHMNSWISTKYGQFRTGLVFHATEN